MTDTIAVSIYVAPAPVGATVQLDNGEAIAAAVQLPEPIDVTVVGIAGPPGPSGADGGGFTFLDVNTNTSPAAGDALIVDASGGAVAITLPAPTLNAEVLVVKNDASSNPVTFAGFESLTVQHQAATFLADGSTWRIVMAYLPNAASTNNVNALKAGYLSNVTAKTTTYTAAAGDYVMASSASGWVLTLPAATAGNVVGVKKVSNDVNAITVTPASGTVDGAANFPITVFDSEYTFTADGTNWNVS